MIDIVFDSMEEADGVTAIRGTCRLADGRVAASLQRIHGKYQVCELPGVSYWVKYDRYDEIEDAARGLITKAITKLVEEAQP